jgi:predicted  nucleic acid-binding Zn-ribbon protein
MFKHLCPQCGKNSYSADENCFLPCPYCGIRFSGRHGSDRRRAERIKKETTCVLNCQGQSFEAESTDFSKEGLGIKISAKTPVALGETIELSTSDLRIKAKIMWVNELADKSLVGLQRIN